MGLVRGVLFGLFAVVLLADCTTLFGAAPDPKRNEGKTLYTPAVAHLVGQHTVVFGARAPQALHPMTSRHTFSSLCFMCLCTCVHCMDGLTAWAAVCRADAVVVDHAHRLLLALPAVQAVDTSNIRPIICWVVGTLCHVVLDGLAPPLQLRIPYIGTTGHCDAVCDRNELLQMYANPSMETDLAPPVSSCSHTNRSL